MTPHPEEAPAIRDGSIPDGSIPDGPVSDGPFSDGPVSDSPIPDTLSEGLCQAALRQENAALRARVHALESQVQVLEQSGVRLRNAQQIAAIGDFIWHEHSGEMIWSDALYDIFAVPVGASVDFADFGSDLGGASEGQAGIRRWLEAG